MAKTNLKPIEVLTVVNTVLLVAILIISIYKVTQESFTSGPTPSVIPYFTQKSAPTGPPPSGKPEESGGPIGPLGIRIPQELGGPGGPSITIPQSEFTVPIGKSGPTNPQLNYKFT